jgi:hypothetical protein
MPLLLPLPDNWLRFPQKLEERESSSLEINWLSAVKHPVSFCTTLMRAGGHNASIILIFSGLALIPGCETRKPSSLPVVTQHTLVRV